LDISKAFDTVSWDYLPELLQHQGCRLLKLDISKAFDTVSWDYLPELLQHQGFSNRWRLLLYSQLHPPQFY
jgi:hypothetical protein